MKKLLAAVLATSVVVLGLAACGAKSTSDKAPSQAEQVKNSG
jgi:ABC-type glycerol-3-phosphate transport system substrate-binding protein